MGERPPAGAAARSRCHAGAAAEPGHLQRRGQDPGEQRGGGGQAKWAVRGLRGHGELEGRRQLVAVCNEVGRDCGKRGPGRLPRKSADHGTCYGLTAGSRQLATKELKKHGEDNLVTRVWSLPQVPKIYCDTDVLLLLGKQGVFGEAKIIKRLHTGQTNEWIFRATSKRSFNSHRISFLNDEGEEVVLWTVIAPPKNGSINVRDVAAQPTGPISTARQNVGSVGAPIMLNQPSRGERAEEGEEGGGERPQELGPKEELQDEEKNGGARSAPAGDRGEKKRMSKGKTVHSLPSGCVVRDVPTDGNCPFAAVGLSLKLMGKKKEESSRLRSEVWSHVKRNEDRYKQIWDGTGADGLMETWDEYIVDLRADKKKAGILELAAIGRMCDCKFVVLNEAAGKPWIAETVHNQGDKGGVAHL